MKCILITTCLFSAGVQAQTRFLESHCFECHDDTVSKGDLNLLDLKFEPDEPANFKIWQRVHDRVRKGEMPPGDQPRPNATDLAKFVESIKTPLLEADRRDRAANGRVRGRRLTRREYEHTVRDLIGVGIPLDEILPQDAASHGFETVAIGQQFSQHNLARYVQVADLILAEAFKRALGNESEFHREIPASRLSSGFHRPQLIGDEVFAWPIRTQYFTRMPNHTGVPEPGWYQMTLRNVRAVNPKNAGVAWGTVRSFRGDKPQLYAVGLIEATEEPKDMSYVTWMRDGHVLEIRPNDTSEIHAPIRRRGNFGYEDTNFMAEGHEGIAWSGIDYERVYPFADHEKLLANLFGGFDPKDIAAVVRRFANRAFRRPVSDAEIAGYINMAKADGLQAGFRGILCSPQFLTLVEEPGKLNDHALATRLSYALWLSIPDAELRRQANAGELGNPAVLRRQIERMLKDPKAERFVESFTDQWLDLKEINFTTPNNARFRTFGVVVQDSMVAETRGFVRELIASDLPITNLIDSDWTMLNRRLARFYGIADPPIEPGSGMKKVSIGNNTIRGGLVTHGSVLKVTADGATTSPVLRGVWINDRLLGLEVPPPPPNLPAIEPDIRGAVSIRDQLARHRNDPSCAVCHRDIDPAGFALESFDPVGLWRTRYSGAPNAAQVDPSGMTPEGEMFADIRQWKKIYRERPKMLTEAFVSQFLTYATGAPPRFSDRDEIAAIVEAAADDQFGLRSILHAALASEIFRMK